MSEFKIKTNVCFYKKDGQWQCSPKVRKDGSRLGAICLGKDIVDPAKIEAARAYADAHRLNIISY